MTVDELTLLLSQYPASAPVCLVTRHVGEAEDFTVEFDGEWVVLEE